MRGDAPKQGIYTCLSSYEVKVEAHLENVRTTREGKWLQTDAENFLKTISARKGVRMLALYYLTRRFNDYVQLAEIAKWIGCHPRSVCFALDPLTEDSVWSSELEKRKIGTAVVYRLHNGPSTTLLKSFFEAVIKEFGERREQGGT